MIELTPAERAAAAWLARESIALQAREGIPLGRCMDILWTPARQQQLRQGWAWKVRVRK